MLSLEREVAPSHSSTMADSSPNKLIVAMVLLIILLINQSSFALSISYPIPLVCVQSILYCSNVETAAWKMVEFSHFCSLYLVIVSSAFVDACEERSN